MDREIKYIEPFKTIEELELAVAELDEWTKPGELYKYLEILYRLTPFYKKYQIENVSYEGLTGTFSGYYSADVLAAAREICSSKFPGSEIWTEDNRLKPELPLAVNYLGNYTAGGMGVIERMGFAYKFEETYNCRLKRQTKEEIIKIQLSAAEYVQKKKHKR